MILDLLVSLCGFSALFDNNIHVENSFLTITESRHALGELCCSAPKVFNSYSVVLRSPSYMTPYLTSVMITLETPECILHCWHECYGARIKQGAIVNSTIIFNHKYSLSFKQCETQHYSYINSKPDHLHFGLDDKTISYA